MVDGEPNERVRLEVKAVDNVGNASESVSVELVVPDTTTQGEILIDVFYDDNQNGFRDMLEEAAAGIAVRVNGVLMARTAAGGPTIIRLDAGTYEVELDDLPPGVAVAAPTGMITVSFGQRTVVCIRLFDVLRNRPGGAEALAKKYAPVFLLRRDNGFWPANIDILTEMREGGKNTQLTYCVNRSGPCLRRDAAYNGTSTLRHYSRARKGRYRVKIDNPFSDRDLTGQMAGFQRYAMDFPGDLDRSVDSSSAIYWTEGGGIRPHNGRPTLTIQYWAFYTFDHQPIPVFSDWAHEGDWEHVAIRFEITDASAGNLRPVSVHFGQHNGRPKQVGWENKKLGWVADSHVKVYVSRRGHANYPTCGDNGKQNRPRLPDDRTVDCDESGDRLYVCPPATCSGARPDYAMHHMTRADWCCFRGRWGPNDSKVNGRSPFSPMRQQSTRGYRQDLCQC